MQATTITVLIFAIICASIGVIYYVQARERARLERIHKIGQLGDRYRRMQQLLHALPPQYVNNELRILITERSIETLVELLNLKSDLQFQQALEQDRNYLKQLRENPPKLNPVPIQNEEAAKNVRELLEVLYRVVESMGKRKILNAASVTRYLQYIQLSACQCRADMFITRAEAAKKIGKLRVAIHNLHNAVSALKDIATHPHAIEAIKSYREQIKALELAADQQNQAVKKDSQKTLEDSTEWDSFLKDDDTWKKKNTYDD